MTADATMRAAMRNDLVDWSTARQCVLRLRARGVLLVGSVLDGGHVVIETNTPERLTEAERRMLIEHAEAVWCELYAEAGKVVH